MREPHCVNLTSDAHYCIRRASDSWFGQEAIVRARSTRLCVSRERSTSVARPASAAGELRDDCYPARGVASATCIFRASAVVPIVAPVARRSIANLDAVTIPELAERIEERLGELRHEIIRLHAANEALASTRTDAAAAQPVPDLRAPARKLELPMRDPGRRRRAPNEAVARRGSKPAAVLALARELDAGLRNRP
jgi:hypothetical protein